jgi:hypothetical protein
LTNGGEGGVGAAEAGGDEPLGFLSGTTLPAGGGVGADSSGDAPALSAVISASNAAIRLSAPS